MDWRDGRERTIAQLEQRVSRTGSFVDRAVVREIKVASELFPEKHGAWVEVVELIERWERGASDLSILQAVQSINRSASRWRIAASSGAGGGVTQRDPAPTPGSADEAN